MTEKSIISRVTRLEELMGEPPDPLGNPGSGVIGTLATMNGKLDLLIAASTRRRDLGAFFAKVAAVPVVGAVVAAVWHWLSGLHH